MQFTNVSDVPLDSASAFLATNVENKGESAITTSPQKSKNAIKANADLFNRNNGEMMQHKQESNNAKVAIFLAPNFNESNPLKTQASPPQPIMMNEKSETFKPASG